VFPVIKVVPLPITQELKKTFSKLATYDWIVFNSINSVRYFFYILMNQFLKFPQKTKIACLGQKTADTLKTYGKQSDYLSGNTDTNVFYHSFLKDNLISNSNKVLIPFSAEEMETENPIEKAGCDCHFLPIYETKINKFIPAPQIEQIKNAEEIIITFFNPLSFENFIKVIPLSDFQKGWELIAGGEKTAQTLLKLGVENFIKAKEAKSDSLFEEVKKLI